MGGWYDGRNGQNGSAPTWQWYATGAMSFIGLLIVALWATQGTAIDELKAAQIAAAQSRAVIESRLTRIEAITERTALDVGELRRLAEAREEREERRRDPAGRR